MERSEVVKITNNFLIEEIEVEENVLTEDAKLKEDLGIERLDYEDEFVIVEKKFHFKIITEEMVDVKFLGNFYDYIMTKVN